MNRSTSKKQDLPLAQRARLVQISQQLEQRVEELEILHRTGRSITALLDLGELLKQIVEASVRITGAEEGYLLLLDEGSGELYLRAGQNLGEERAQGLRLKVNDSVAGSVVRTGKPAMINNREERIKTGYLVKSLLNSPLKVRGKVIGVLGVDNRKSDEAFSEDHLHMLSILADYAAIAIQNARLLEDAKQQARNLETLQNLALTISSSLDLDETLRKVCQAAVRFFDADHSGLVLFDPGQEAGKVRAEYPTLGTLGRRIPIRGVEAEEQLIETREPLVIHNVKDNHTLGPVRDLLLEFNIQSILVVPMITKDGELLGSFSLDAVDHKGEFTTEEVNLCRVFAAQAAVAVENARLFSQLREAKEQLSGLIGSSFDAVVAIDQSKRITIFNKRAEKLFGWTREEMLHQTVARLYRHVEKARDLFDVVNRTELVTGCNVELKHRDGTSIPALLSAALIKDREGRPIGQAGFIRDLRKEKRREQLLTALDEASRYIRAEKETPKLLQAITRLAAQLVGCTAGSLFINLPHLGELELRSVYGLPARLIGRRLSHMDGVAGLVARTGQPQIVGEYSNWPNREAIFEPWGFNTLAGIPIEHAGVVEAVLIVADDVGPRRITQIDLEILQRFAAQAAIALRTSRLMNREQRMFSQLSILHQISDYIQASRDLDKILHVVLTGVTAGYGLGFNRAALFLQDERREHLIGRMGIGHLRAPEARRDWAHHRERGLENFRRYLELLERDSFPLTPVGERIREIRLRARPAACGLFLLAMSERRCVLVDQEEDLARLPKSFVEAFEPTLPLIIVPVIARDQVVGVLVADNKFTQSPITPEDEEALLALVSTAAVAIHNTELMARDRQRLRRLEMLSRASNEMMSNLRSLKLEDRLNSIISNAVQILDAEAGSILLVKRPGFLRLEACYGYRDNLQKGRQFVIQSREGSGLTGHVASTGTLFNAHGRDLLTHWAVAGKEGPYVISGECHSLLMIPLRRKRGEEDELIGMLRVENKRDEDGQPKSHIGFTKEDEWILNIFAKTVVICLENAELYERTSDRLEDKIASLEAIQQTSAAISTDLDLDELLELLTEKAATVLEFPAASLMLWDDRKQNLVVRAKYGLGDEYLQQRVPKERVEEEIASMEGLRPLATEDLRSTPYGRPELIETEHLCSVLSAPLVVTGDFIGILNIYSRGEPCHFSSDQIEVAEVLASQAAVAIQNARLYRQLEQHASIFEALYDAGQTITASLELDVILDRLLQQARRLTGKYGKEAFFGDILLMDGGKLRFASAFPEGALDELQDRFRSHIDLEAGVNNRKGVTGRAVRKGTSQLVTDVTQDPDFYQVYDEKTLSELAVPIKIGGKVIGVINVEHPDYDAFDEEDQKSLEALAAQAAIAIENARHFEELKKIKGYIGSKTAVDWIRMVSTAWGHSVRREVGTALGLIMLLRGALDNGGSVQKAKKELDRLENVVKRIKGIPITAPLSYEDAVGSVQINGLVKTHLERQWKHIRYKPIELRFDLQEDLDTRVTVRASPEWLRRALEILVDNSVYAMLDADSPKKQLTATTRLVGETVEISVSDTGPGIPESVLDKIFVEPIDKPVGSRGAGIGLILAQTIVQTYSGEIRVDVPSDEGANIILTLPVEN